MTHKAVLLIELEIEDPDNWEMMVRGIASALRTIIPEPPHGGVTAWLGEDAVHVADIAQGREPVLKLGDVPILLMKDEDREGPITRLLVGGTEVVRTADVFKGTVDEGLEELGGPLTIKYGFED